MTARTYVAGPMSGIASLNFPAFHAEAARQRALGHEVINPAEINGGADELVACATMTLADYQQHWVKCMRSDIEALMTCDRVVMLPGWHNSRGATLERHVALALGFEVLDSWEVNP